MTSKLLALVGTALALLMASAAANPADAGRGGHGGHSFSGARSFGGGSSARSQFRATQFGSRPQTGSYVRPQTSVPQAGSYARPQTSVPQRQGVQYGYVPKPHGRRHRHRHILVGVPVFYGGYYYYYGQCDWLRRRALATGSPYWWDRYNTCVYDAY